MLISNNLQLSPQSLSSPRNSGVLLYELIVYIILTSIFVIGISHTYSNLIFKLEKRRIFAELTHSFNVSRVLALQHNYLQLCPADEWQTGYIIKIPNKIIYWRKYDFQITNILYLKKFNRSKCFTFKNGISDNGSFYYTKKSHPKSMDKSPKYRFVINKGVDTWQEKITD